MAIKINQILGAFAALRASGARSPTMPGSEEELAGARFYGKILVGAGAGPDELERAVLAYVADPKHKPEFPLPWPSAGALLSYLQAAPAVNLDEEFRALLEIANRPAGHVVEGDQLVLRRPRDVWDLGVAGRYPGGVPEAVEAGLQEIGGAPGLRGIRREEDVPWVLGRFRKAGRSTIRLVKQIDEKPGLIKRLLGG